MVRKPVWSEGLFVTQHHFQQLDRYHEDLLRERVAAVVAFEWGVSELEIDERALAAGQFRIVRLVAILPDGTPIGADGDDAVASRSLEGAFSAQARSLDVYVALPREGDAIANVDLDARPGVHARYARAQVQIADYNSGASEQGFGWARPNLRILFGDERREGFEAIRIAQLVRAANGSVVLRDSFVPPLLRIGASSFLKSGFARVLSAMTGRQRSLAESRRQRTASAVEFQASDAAKFWLLNVINGAIPTLAHVADHPHVGPESAYLELARVIGQLMTFAVDGDPTTIPKFNYLELGEVFEPMFARVLALLNAVIAERYVQIPLQRREDGMYLGKIEDPQILRYEFFLAASGTMPESTVRDRLPRLMKIASWNHIGAILNSAINGARIELEYRPPGALPIRPGVTFFKVGRTPEFWPDIAGTGTIAIYHPSEPSASVELALYAVDPANLQ
jgi:type VI secretion system protein ImpJ